MEVVTYWKAHSRGVVSLAESARYGVSTARLLDRFAEIAAKVLRGNTVAPGVRLLVTPASQAVYREAMRRGYLQDIADAGGVVTNSTCGACFGYHMGVVGPGEVCITSSTRNFTGRMGSTDAQIFMASPATVAASAIAGYITDPRTVTA